MKKILFGLLILGFFSCGEVDSNKIFQGKLEDFVVDEFILKKDSTTKRINLQKQITYNEEHFFLSKDEKGYSLFSASNGEKNHSFTIPDEGPISLNGYHIASQGFDNSEFVAISSTGNVKMYIDGDQRAEINLDWSAYDELPMIQMSDKKDNFRKIEEGHFQLVNNPTNPFAENYVDVNFGNWIAEFDLRDGWICTSDFSSGLGEEFSNSSSAANLISVHNPINDEFYVMFSPSDSLFQIKNCEVVRKLKLTSLSRFDYLPGIYEKNGRNRSWRSNPKSAANTDLAYDPINELYLRMVKVKTEESRPEVTDIRLRQGLNKNTYLMLVYNSKWELKAELEIIYDIGQTIGNLIATPRGVFIPKPEQKSEDEYELYKIDLSKFSN
ncbi:hypothetical protein [uncultured Algoriphagus sp.]|uniref:hypothetical protein n=1 Tax=uncultured Algoriphagus sp. TaxID=417365 RepID=UPI00258D5D6E|nr:hypothetical protein [uncultured Algoriphagus sp.]